MTILRIIQRLGNNSISPSARMVVRLGIIGIALAVFGVIVAVSVGKGYQHKIRERIFGFAGHIQILPVQLQYSYSGAVFYTTGWLDSLQSKFPGLQMERFIYQPVIFHHKSHTVGGVLRGVERLEQWDRIPGRFLMHAPNIAPSDLPPIILSTVHARQLGVQPGDSILVFWNTPRLRVRQFKVIAIYQGALEELEEVFAVSHLQIVQQMRNDDSNAIHGISIFLSSHQNLPDLTARIADAIPYYLHPFTIKELYPQVFDWLGLLDNNIQILLVLMSIVAMVTLMVVFFVLVIDRGFTVSMWKLLGAPPRFFRWVFWGLSIRILGYGVGVGMLFALILLALQDYFHLVRLPEDVYYLSYVPIAWPWGTWLLYISALILAGMFGLGLASFYFYRVSPYRVVRNER